MPQGGTDVWVGTRAARARKRQRARIGSIVAALVVIAVLSVIGWQSLEAGPSHAKTPVGGGSPSDPVTATARPEPSREPTLTVAPAPPPTVTVNAVGDIAFVSSVQRLMAATGQTAPIDDVAQYVGDADLTIANLETALSERGSAVPGKTFTFRSSPAGSVAALRKAGIDVVSLANNHTKDWGGDALVDTLHTLDEAAIRWAGAGRNADEAFAPVMLESNGVTVAYLAYSQIGPSNFVASDTRSGTAYSLSLGDMKRAVARAHDRADYVIVSFHWGIEKDYSPTERQVTFGRAAIDAGADAVLAHHPHVLQGIEFYGDGLIAYSLGNFVFSPGSAAGRDTMVLSFKLSPTGISEATARAAYIHPSGATRLAEGSTAERITSLIRDTSSDRGSEAVVGTGGTTVTLKARP